LISVICPTIAGREEHLARMKAAYAAHTDDYELIVVPNDGRGCGVAWNEGAEAAVGDYIHFTADDLTPHAGWWQAAKACVERGYCPAPVLYWPDGRLQACGGSWESWEDDGRQTAFTRVPFLSREQWDAVRPMLPIHYYTDNYVTFRCGRAGWPTVNCHGYAFTHHMAQEGRVESERMGPDGRAYMEAVLAA
jgi:glycosyltransferase involved in cell wall biosynthesis